VEIVESIVEIEVTREDNIEGRSKRGITMPHMYSSFKKAKIQSWKPWSLSLQAKPPLYSIYAIVDKML